MRKLLLLLVLLQSHSLYGKIVLPDMFSDNMVLQQKSSIKLWGIAKPKKCVTIKVSWSDKIYQFHTKKDGNWSVVIETPAASFEKQSITFSDGQESTLNNILIGEVWFCSGQSNMEMTLKGYPDQPIQDSEITIKEANPENGIRLLKVKRNGQEVPVDEAEGKWMLSTEQNVPNFSAVAYFYALALKEKLDVPIGVITSSYGGTAIESWLNIDFVDNYSDLDLSKQDTENETWKKVSVLYNGMVHPYINYSIKGFIWYQGEANIGRYKTYTSKLKDLVALWRSDWKLGEIPFYLVEIAPYKYDENSDAARLRESQFKATSIINNCDIVSTNDLVFETESSIIHPSQKKPVAQRLSNLALLNTYGIDSLCAKSPSYNSMNIISDTILLNFKDCYNGLTSKSEIFGFEIAGEDKVFYPANAKILGDQMSIKVFSDTVRNPIAVRYCFKNFSFGSVTNSCGLPLFGFRTDNW